MKVLTVLVPVYNTELYIKRCLDSVLLKEVLDDIEVITVSDGSQDSSVDIIKDYLKKYPKTLRLIEKENGGHGSTINRGLEEATGKYFKVLDSDDWVNPVDFIEFVKRLKNEDADLVVTDYQQEHIYNQTVVPYKYKDLEENKVYSFNKFNIDILHGEYFVMATSTYKLDVLKKSNLHLLEKTFYVDMQYNIEPIINVNTFVYYELSIYRYYIGRKEQSVNTESFIRNYPSHEKVMIYLIEYYKNNRSELTKNKQKYIEMILNYMINTHYSIQTVYNKDHKNAYKAIKAFDKVFKSLDRDLYNKSNKIALIRAHRKTGFIFVKVLSSFFRKVFNILYKIRHR